VLKFGTKFNHGTAGILQMFKVKSQRSRSQCNVTYQQLNCYKTAMQRLSDFKLGIGDEIKAIGTAQCWVASSCNTIGTFSSFVILSEV